MTTQNSSHKSQKQNNAITYDRDALEQVLTSNPTICYLCRGLVNSSLPAEQRQSFPTTELVDYIIKHKFVFPLDIYSDVARRYADAMLFFEIRNFIHDAAQSVGHKYDQIDISSVFYAMDTLLDLVVRDDVDVTTVLFDYDLHVEGSILFVDRSYIKEVPPEEQARLKEMAVGHIQMPQNPYSLRMQRIFDSLFEIFGELFEDTRLEFNHRLLMIGIKTFLDIHHYFLDAAFKPRSDDLAPLYDAFLMMLQPELDNYSPFTPIRVSASDA